jgi:RNA polymerase sigma factor (sigma-70 family)
MAGAPSAAFLRDIQTLFDSGTAGGLSDRQLLERFAGTRGASAEAAFEVLVLRHGPMVFQVCFNVLRDPTDAQDAFQATFMVLVRRSGTVRKLESLGSWLYGVAYRVAARARVEAARRRAAERCGGLRVLASATCDDVELRDRAELGPVIQEEVRRLPEKYRGVVVLCYWEGLTQEQAATQLGCPLGTVRSRLVRARQLLHRRLNRRGLAPLAAVVATSLDSALAGAVPSRLVAVPPELVHATIRAAARVGAGQATSQAASGAIASLVQQMVWSLTMIKMKSLATGVVLVGLTSIGAGIAAQRVTESGQVATAAPASRATQDGGPGRAQLDTGQKSAQEKPAAKSAGGEKIYSAVEGSTAIMSLVPNGSTVKKGDIVCQLDTAALKDQLTNQQITTAAAMATWENAQLTREVAELAVVEYEDGVYRREHADLDAEIQLAEAVISLADEELKAAQAATENRALAIKRAEVDKIRGSIALKKAQGRLRVLEDFTRGKTIKELKSEVLKAITSELAKKSIWDLESMKLKKLDRQITACEIRAPIDGTLVYAGGRTQTVLRKDGTPALVPVVIEEGAQVRERQALFEIVPASGTKPVSR